MEKRLSRIQYNSPVVLTYALVSLAVVLVGQWFGPWALYNLFSVYKSSFTNPLAYIRAFGHALGHVSFEHYFANILVILMVGPMLEEKYGSKQLAALMAVTALITGVIHMISFDMPLTGGSGIVFMFILLGSYANVRKGTVPLTLIVTAAVFIGNEALQGLKSAGNIAYSTHVLGGLCGAGFGFFLNKRRQAKTGGEAPEPAEDESNIGIIDLTGEEGM